MPHTRPRRFNASQAVVCCSTSSPAATRSSRPGSATTSATTNATAAPANSSTCCAGCRTPAGTTYDLDGEYYQIAGARIDYGDWDPPQVFFGGASSAAEEVAAQYVDTYLAWGETPTRSPSGSIACAPALPHGRTLEFGIRLHVISRDTSAEAWAHAERLLSAISDERIASAQQVLARSESVGQQRMTALHEGRTANLEISPNLWAGYGLVRGGAGTALVGSHTEVADRIAEYHDLGIDHFILSGQPHVEEAYWFAEGAGAVLRSRGLV